MDEDGQKTELSDVEIMGLIGCKNFELHPTIEECIQKFRC